MARRTAKQKAATRKLVALNKKRRAKRSAPKRRKTRTKVITKVRRVTRMARRRTRRSSPRRKSGGFLKGLPLVSNPTFKKAAAGIGTATLGVAALSLIAPGLANSPIVKPVLALAGGDFIGLGAQLFTSGGLGSVFGGSGGTNMDGMA